MRIAIIDCGTNTFHLLVVDILKDRSYKFLYRAKAVVKLGEGGITKKYIAPKAFRRGLNALKKFSIQIEKYAVKKTIATATEALRSAENGSEFLKEAKNKFGIKPELISGDREAELIYKGVSLAIKMDAEPSLVMDIGGGSIEFIIGNNKKILWKRSFKMGAALLLEKYQPSDPVKKNEIKTIVGFFRKELHPLLEACNRYKPEVLIGSSGSFESFAEMILSNDGEKLGERKEFVFNLKKYRKLHRMLLNSTTEQRMNMKGLVKMRVDMIVMASLVLTFALENTGVKRMKLSSYALKEGILNEIISGK